MAELNSLLVKPVLSLEDTIRQLENRLTNLEKRLNRFQLPNFNGIPLHPHLGSPYSAQDAQANNEQVINY